MFCAVAVQALEHRIQRNLEAEAEDLGAAEIVGRIVAEVQEACRP